MSEDQINANGENKANLPVEFTFEEHTLRTVVVDDEIRFVAADACAVLGIKNPTDAVDRLDEDEKALVCIEGIPGGQAVNVVNEFGLYSLILTSRKPQAKKFKRWVTHEVLPSIRKTGRYEIGQGQAEQQETADTESRRNAGNRLFTIYKDGHLNPDHLLKALFGSDIPYTPSRKHPFFLTQCCEALGISETTAAGRIPDSQITTLIIEAGEEQIERRAITEAALYFLAFARRTLAPNQIGSKEEHKNAEDWVQIPKRNVGQVYPDDPSGWSASSLPVGFRAHWRRGQSTQLSGGLPLDQNRRGVLSQAPATLRDWHRPQRLSALAGPRRGRF